MSILAPAFFVAALAILAYVSFAWIASLRLRDSGVMDVFWGPGFVVAVVAAGVASDSLEPSGRDVVTLALVAVWATRLAIHIGIRNHDKPEDFRYARWRREAGDAWWWRSYLKVFLLQGAVMLVVIAPVVVLISSSTDGWPGPLGAAGLLVWLAGFLFEAVGDEQLRRFKKSEKNAGKVMDRGLWKYTRHPNYFGESLVWWGFWILACEVPGGWMTVVSPLLMTWLLIRVSGVAMLERGLESSRAGYADYKRRTNAFIPGPPRPADR